LGANTAVSSMGALLCELSRLPWRVGECRPEWAFLIGLALASGA
jgi:hypothetical protein